VQADELSASFVLLHDLTQSPMPLDKMAKKRLPPVT